MAILLYPIFLLHFWYIEGNVSLLTFFGEVNKYCLELLSLPLLIKTFVSPLKNEYRGDLVLFSIVSGIFIKSVLIFTTFVIILFLLFVEMIFYVSFLILPVLFVYLLI